MSSRDLNNSHINAKKRQPSRAARQRVHDAFDANMLQAICEDWDFREFADFYPLEPRMGRERFYWYADNGSDVLAVAHLDTVQDDRRCQITETAAGLLATSGALDDRLGAYVILDLLPELGIKCDVLLTTDEEIGQSTASEFDPPDGKDYKWMFQFDRGGTDVVMYQYETLELTAAVEASGARVGQGIFSDICELDHLGCAGLNWGVGYQDYHSERSHAWLEDTFRMVARFVKFYNANKGIHWKYEDRWSYSFTGHQRTTEESDYQKWWDEHEDKYVQADCGHYINVEDDTDFVEIGSFIACASCGAP